MSEYLAADKALSIAAAIVILMAGWLFTLIITAQQTTTAKQTELVERIAILETIVDRLMEPGTDK